MRILIIGGARKKHESIFANWLADDHHVVLVDNLSKDGFASVPAGPKFIFADARDEVLLSRIAKDSEVDCILWNIRLRSFNQGADPIVAQDLNLDWSHFQVQNLAMIRAVKVAIDNGLPYFFVLKDKVQSEAMQSLINELRIEVAAMNSSKLKIIEILRIEDICKYTQI